MNLICRLYDVNDGEVRVGGINVRDYDMEALRNQVAVVLQKNTLFTGTILDNLRWGNADATLEECKAACRAACADEFIDRFPDGYDTRIERGGNNVSGGIDIRIASPGPCSRSRRCSYSTTPPAPSTPPPTRASAPPSARAYPGTTKIIIAQRISSVQDADRILVLDEGRINAFDTHENLLKTNEIYKDIYESQINGGGDFDQPG